MTEISRGYVNDVIGGGMSGYIPGYLCQAFVKGVKKVRAMNPSVERGQATEAFGCQQKGRNSSNRFCPAESDKPVRSQAHEDKKRGYGSGCPQEVGGLAG